MITVDDIKFYFIANLSTKNTYHCVYRDNKYGLQKEQITRRTNGGYDVGKTKTFYFIDKDKREFKSLDELIKVLNNNG